MHDELAAVGSARRMMLAITAVDWYAARAGGVVAYLLLSAVVIIGLALAGKERLPGWPRFALEDVHRFGGLLVGVFVSAHVLLLLIDAQAHLSLGRVVIPFSSSFRPLWTGLGTVAAELLLALAVANHYRKRISYTHWRRLHYLNFAVWLAASAHGLGAGTDRVSVWLLWMYFIAIGAVAGLTVRRVVRSAPATQAVRIPAD